MMNFVLPTPSLEHIAGVKIVTHLWSQPDTFTDFDYFPGDVISDDDPEWRKIRHIVERKVSALPLPEPCKQQLINLVNPLGSEIIEWCQYHDDYIQNPDLFSPNQLCWTIHGTIDYKKTAELMVKDERMDTQRRLELACVYCLEDEARELVQKVTLDPRSSNSPIPIYTNRCYVSQMAFLFASSIDLDVYDLPSPWLSSQFSSNKLHFEMNLPSGNRAMCEFLFQTLTQEEKEEVFEDCQTNISACTSTCGLLYYLSLINEEQQRFAFRECTFDLLTSLLRWPLQSLFMDAAKCGWQFMDDRSCSKVLFVITRSISTESNEYDYSQLFWGCWRLSSAEEKQSYFDDFGNLVALMDTRRAEFIKLFLNEALSHQILAACERYHEISDALMDESAISDAALVECKETAVKNSLNDKENVDKRSRSDHLSRLIMKVMEGRINESRE